MSGLSDAMDKVVDVPRHEFAGDKPISQAKAWAKNNLTGKHTLTDSAGETVEYEISGKVIDKYLSGSAVNKSDSLGVHLSVQKHLPEIIGNSIEAEAHTDYSKDPDGRRLPENAINPKVLVHRFYGATSIDGKVCRVKSTILEMEGEEINPTAMK
ncbi:MAG: hypothetical protein HDR94_02430 [Bacteroides sp.]|nr:hypothetical protein [Bacteroides sp.]